MKYCESLDFFTEVVMISMFIVSRERNSSSNGTSISLSHHFCPFFQFIEIQSVFNPSSMFFSVQTFLKSIALIT